jgi:hypothetical protein
MKILAIEIELPGAEKSDFQALAKEEAVKVWELYQAGSIRELYYRKDKSEAVLMLESESVKEAGRILAALPLVEAGLIDFELIPLTAYPGFARLFDSQTVPRS